MQIFFFYWMSHKNIFTHSIFVIQTINWLQILDKCPTQRRPNILKQPVSQRIYLNAILKNPKRIFASNKEIEIYFFPYGIVFNSCRSFFYDADKIRTWFDAFLTCFFAWFLSFRLLLSSFNMTKLLRKLIESVFFCLKFTA